MHTSPFRPENDRFWAICSEAGINLATHLASVTRYGAQGLDWNEEEVILGDMDVPGPSTTATARRWRPSALRSCRAGSHGSKMKPFLSEQGTVWAPYIVRKMDHAFLMGRRGTWGTLDRRPSEYFREHCFVAPFPEENVDRVIDAVGTKPIVFGSDFPHGEGLPEPELYLGQLKNLNDDDQRRSCEVTSPLPRHRRVRWPVSDSQPTNTRRSSMRSTTAGDRHVEPPEVPTRSFPVAKTSWRSCGAPNRTTTSRSYCSRGRPSFCAVRPEGRGFTRAARTAGWWPTSTSRTGRISSRGRACALVDALEPPETGRPGHGNCLAGGPSDVDGRHRVRGRRRLGYHPSSMSTPAPSCFPEDDPAQAGISRSREIDHRQAGGGWGWVIKSFRWTTSRRSRAPCAAKHRPFDHGREQDGGEQAYR
jgi:hypothetical protein